MTTVQEMLTGHGPSPRSGIVFRTDTEGHTSVKLTREALPYVVEFEGRMYVINGTAGGGLQMTRM